MNPKRKRRLIFTVLVIAAAAVAVSLIVYALQQNMNYLYSPSEVLAGKAPAHTRFRLGGVVKADSIHRDDDTDSKKVTVTFTVTDRFHDMPVVYHGVLPDLFRVGQSVITTGSMDGKHFLATEVLAKHDSTYMPKEVADAIKKAEAAGRAKDAQHVTAPAGGSK